VPDAVNVKGGEIHEEIRPTLPLVEKMAQIATGLEAELPVSIEITVKGEVSIYDSTILATSALKGALIAIGTEDATYVNSPNLAQEKGMSAMVSSEAEC
jgi:D-3-phosphoglycerate dehydrogenase